MGRAMGELIKLPARQKPIAKLRHRGVYKYRNTWHAVIAVDGKQLDLGVFDTPEAAWTVLMEEEFYPMGTYCYGDHWRAVYLDRIIGEFETQDQAFQASMEDLYLSAARYDEKKAKWLEELKGRMGEVVERGTEK
jgi:hypothetical protein